MPTESQQSQMRTGSRVVIDALEQAGVSVAFGYPGGAIMPLYDELLNTSVRHVLTRHEQGAIHAADGFARATGKVGVCIATSGCDEPGDGHLHGADGLIAGALYHRSGALGADRNGWFSGSRRAGRGDVDHQTSVPRAFG